MMNTELWVVQILLAFVFIMAMAMKMMRPRELLVENMGRVEDFPQGQLRVH